LARQFVQRLVGYAELTRDVFCHLPAAMRLTAPIICSSVELVFFM